MVLKPAEIIAGGIFVLTGLANMKASKKWIPWVLVSVGIGVLAAAFWQSADETKTTDILCSKVPARKLNNFWRPH